MKSEKLKAGANLLSQLDEANILLNDIKNVVVNIGNRRSDKFVEFHDRIKQAVENELKAIKQEIEHKIEKL